MPGTLHSASDFIKRLKNVKLSSKSGFSPQELPNWSQNTNMKWLKNVKLSSKSCFSPQELQNLSQDTHMKRINPQQLPNLTQDTNMKRLNYVKLSSQSGFSPHELPNLSQDTITTHRPPHCGLDKDASSAMLTHEVITLHEIIWKSWCSW